MFLTDLSWATPSCPAGKLQYLRFFDDGATVIKLENLSSEIYTTIPEFQSLLLSAFTENIKIIIHAKSCKAGSAFDEFSVVK